MDLKLATRPGKHCAHVARWIGLVATWASVAG